MCTGACSKFIAIPLYVLALLSIICNFFLFFPDLDTQYAAQDRNGLPWLTEEVKYMGGVVGGGIMVSTFHQVQFSVTDVRASRNVKPHLTPR